MSLFLIVRGIRKRSASSANKDFLDQKHRVTLGEKGSQSIHLASERLHDGIHAEAGDLVHRTCRGQYTNQKAIEGKLKKKLKLKSPRKRRQPRSEDSKPKCLFCGKEEKDQKSGGKRSLVGQLKAVQTVEFQETVLRICSSRGDSWARDVKGKIEFLQDCVAQDVVYHNACFSNFRSDCQIPKMFRSEEPARKISCSWRHNNTRLSAFDNVIQYLDTLDSEQVMV